MKTVVLLADKKDNVVTCMKALSAGEKIQVNHTICIVKEEIPIYHKMAIVQIEKGKAVYKYGQIIGQATQNIDAGSYVHVHNVESTRGRVDKKWEE